MIVVLILHQIGQPSWTAHLIGWNILALIGQSALYAFFQPIVHQKLENVELT